MEIRKEELMVVETSLRNFFLKEKTRHAKNSNDNNHALLKYRGLSLTLNDDNPRNILFIVRIGTLEAQFRLFDGSKVQGSLAGDERIVLQWFLFGGNKEQLSAIVETKKDKKKVDFKHKANINTDKKTIFDRAGKSQN